MGEEELAYMSAAEQGRLIRERKLSPVELVQLCLKRIERYNPVLRAYITVCGEAALAAARQALGVEAPPADPYAPGPFAFADELRLRDMLEGAGFKDVVIQPYDHSVRLGANAADAAEGSIRFGPASRFIREMGEAAVAKVLPAMTESLKPFEKGGECAPPGATWIVTAKVV